MQAADQAISAAQSGYYPTLGFSANYYISRPNGIYQGVDWDVGLYLSFALFSGGLTRSQVKEAHILRFSKELNVKLTNELAVQSIRTLASTFESDLDQIEKLSSSSSLSQRSYLLVHRDNRLGMATNTDVLTALQTWQEARRNLERAKLTAAYDFTRLLLETSNVDLDGNFNAKYF